MEPEPLPSFQGSPVYGFKPTVYFPSLLRQQNWVVRQPDQVNYRNTLNYSFGGELYTEEVILQGPDILPQPQWTEEGWKLPTIEKGFLTQDFMEVGQEVHFFFRGYPTYLYQEEFDLLEPILDTLIYLTIDEREGIPYRRLHIYGIVPQPNS